MRRRNALFALLFIPALAVLSIVMARGQERSTKEPQAVTIRTQAAEVLVDAVVLDRKGRPVSNLKPEDFIVYEDGVRQQVASFRVFDARTPAGREKPETTAPQPAVTPSPPAPELPLRQATNLTMLLLDYSTTEFQNQKLVREAAIKHVETRLRPGDLMAVMAVGPSLQMLTPFTGDKETLIASLKTGNVSGSALAGERASLNETRSNVPGDAEAAPLAAPTGVAASGVGPELAAEGSERATQMLAQRIRAQFVALRSATDERVSRELIAAIRAIALGVRDLEGRKSLVLFSQGFVVGEAIEDQLHAAVGAANRSQLTIYCIDSQGLLAPDLSGNLAARDELATAADCCSRTRVQAVGGRSLFDRVLEAGRGQEESALRFVANETGGFLIRNTNDLNVGLERVAEELHSYYLLSYRPSRPDFDGKFRQIRVEVQQPGVSVRARSGYYAIPPGLEFLTPEEFDTVRQAGATPEAAQIPLFVRAAGLRSAEARYNVPVVLEFPAKSVKFEASASIRMARLQAIGIVRDAGRNLVTRFGGRLQFSLTEAEHRAVEPGNLSALYTLGLAPGSYIVELVLKDLGSGVLARRETGVYLRPPERALTLSTVLLAKNVERGAGQAGFLSAGGARILPLAQNQFRNGENLVFFFEVYHPSLDPQQAAKVSVELWLMKDGRRWNARLPNYELTQAEPQPVPHFTVAKYVQLSGLPAGDYFLVVQARDTNSGSTDRAQASFTVIN